MVEANLQAAWARLLLSSLADAGVQEVVISPGSRSTPFVVAALGEPRFRCHSLIDERAAAFFALGQGKRTGRPSLLLCTSGTAGANYLPAVVEAGRAYAPLLVLTADRPLSLQACGANQTIDQQKLFGDHSRAFFDLGLADADPGALRALRRIAGQAVFTSRFPQPGAVHLNVRARKPLEPGSPDTPAEVALAAQVDALLATPPTQVAVPRQVAATEAVETLARLLATAERGLIVCGPAPLAAGGASSALQALAVRTGFPILAEAASQMRFRTASAPGATFVDAFDTLLRCNAFCKDLQPDLVLQIGAAPTSGAWDVFLTARPEQRRWVIAEQGWNDPQSSAAGLLFGDVEATLVALEAAVAAQRTMPPPTAHPWCEALGAAEVAAWQAVEAELKAIEGLSEGAAVRAVVEALPAGALLAVGNSLPIREIDTFCPGADRPLAVWSQRGASGIDGLMAGTSGAVAAGEGPAALLIGDVSFLHDLGGLAAAATLTTPLAIVVLHNGGGRIFEQLPLATHQVATEGGLDYWTTPHDLDLASAAALFGLPHRRVEARGGLQEAVATALDTPGATVIEARVAPHGAAQCQQLWRRVDAALAVGVGS